jgi:hypothetical protein
MAPAAKIGASLKVVGEKCRVFSNEKFPYGLLY